MWPVYAWRAKVRVVTEPHERDAAFRIARVALVKSGTSTLEVALAGVPMVATYKVSEIEAFVARRVLKVPMTTRVSRDKHEYDVSIPGILDLQTRAIVNPGRTEPVMSTGIMDAFGDRFVHSDTPRHTYSDPTLGTEWDLTGRQSNQAEFALDSARVAQGGIGWGCWTAHSDFGDEAP